MANKKDVTIPQPGDIGNDFDETDEILNFRPRIEFVEPDPQYFKPQVEELETIDSVRDRTQKLVNGLDALVKLVDIAQKRVDQRVKAAGSFNTKLDSKRDHQTIAAMKRRFPNKKDPAEITYADYKAALNCLQKTAPAVPQVTAGDIRAAKSDPNRTAFGGLDNQKGQNRAELSSPGMEPMDLEEFQKKSVIALHKLMEPLIKGTASAAISSHKTDTPHK